MFLRELATLRYLAIPILVFVGTQLGPIKLKQRSLQLPSLAVDFNATAFSAVKAPGRESVRFRYCLTILVAEISGRVTDERALPACVKTRCLFSSFALR